MTIKHGGKPVAIVLAASTVLGAVPALATDFGRPVAPVIRIAANQVFCFTVSGGFHSRGGFFFIGDTASCRTPKKQEHLRTQENLASKLI